MAGQISLVISIITFLLTILTVVFTYRFNRITIRNTAKQEHQKMLLEVNKMMIADPTLWTIYDDHPLAEGRVFTKEEQGRKEALIYYYLNYFDVIYEFYNKHIIMNRTDKETWRAWKEYMEYFFRRSSTAREIAKQAYPLYESEIAQYYGSILDKVETELRTKAS